MEPSIAPKGATTQSPENLPERFYAAPSGDLLEDLEALCDAWYERFGSRNNTYVNGQWNVMLTFARLVGLYRKAEKRPGGEV